MKITLYLVRQLAKTLWREIAAAVAGAVCAAVLLSAGASLAAAAALLAINLAGAGALLRLSVGQGQLHRALRWPRACSALGLSPTRLQAPPLEGIVAAAEEVLQIIDGALPAVRRYLEPARRGTLEVVQRSVELTRLAGKHRQQVLALEDQTLDQSMAELKQRLATEADPAVRQQLEARGRSLRQQQQVQQEHQQALWRIESELEAARQTLGAVDAQIHRVDQLLTAPAEDGPGALAARGELQTRVSALALAASDLTGGAR